jgi:hypothetical protein
METMATPTFKLEEHIPQMPDYTEYLETGSTTTTEIRTLASGRREDIADRIETIQHSDEDPRSHPEAALKVRRVRPPKTWQTLGAFLTHATDRGPDPAPEPETEETEGLPF